MIALWGLGSFARAPCLLGLPFIDEQPPGESIELDEELLGEQVVIWVLEKHNNDVVRDG